MVLGFSRHMFARVVFDQRIETWLRLHIETFATFGGVVDTVVPDNLKAAVIHAAFGLSDNPALNPRIVSWHGTTGSRSIPLLSTLRKRRGK